MSQSEDDKNKWLHLRDKYNEYHARQLSEVYRSTVLLCDWLETLGLVSEQAQGEIVDIGAGQGGNLLYLSRRYPRVCFTGVEINPDLVRLGNERFDQLGQRNCILKHEDLERLDSTHFGRYDGVISFQTLSWLPEHETPIRSMAALGPRWIAMSSLFFEGEAECQITVRDYSEPFQGKPYEQFYTNVYSLPRVTRLFAELGYPKFRSVPFEIDVELPRSERKTFGTYTERTEDGRLLQVSGPLLMPWYFVAAWK